jgi:hypothetical protein
VEAGDSRCIELQRCLARTKDTDEVELMMEEVVDRNVDDEIIRKDSDKQIQISIERKGKALQSHFPLMMNNKATKEREELLKDLAMSRMSDRMSLLKQENSERRCLVKEMQEQMESLVDENRILREDIYERNDEKYISISVKDELEDLDQVR